MSTEEVARDNHDYWAGVCICGMSEQERMGHYPEHERWCEVPSPLDDEDEPCDRCVIVPTPGGRCICR